jgi:hypothetical protein
MKLFFLRDLKKKKNCKWCRRLDKIYILLLINADAGRDGTGTGRTTFEEEEERRKKKEERRKKKEERRKKKEEDKRRKKKEDKRRKTK